jgi:hypothetical protein
VNQKSSKVPFLVIKIIILRRTRNLLLLKGNEKSDWGLFKVVADNYRTFVENMFGNLTYMRQNMSLQMQLQVIRIFAINFGDPRYKHSERLHQDIYNMKTLPREMDSSNACQLQLATSERHSILSTCIHTHIPWFHECVPKTAGCGKSHRYLNRHNFYSIKYE